MIDKIDELRRIVETSRDRGKMTMGAAVQILDKLSEMEESIIKI